MRQNEPEDQAPKSLCQKTWHLRTDFPVVIACENWNKIFVMETLGDTPVTASQRTVG